MGDWQNAISLNESLLEENPQDIDTLNRLAFAYASLGNNKEAKIIYEKVLDLDNQNPIALRNIKRLNGPASQKTVAAPMYVSNLFIEEPGKTKVIELLNVADKKIISPLRSGEQIHLQVKRMKVFLLDQNKQYIGMLPDDIGLRLIRFINGGNDYEAYIKSVDNNKVIIFARETKRSPRFKNQPSFQSSDKTKLVLTQKHPGNNSEANEDTDYDDDSSEDES